MPRRFVFVALAPVLLAFAAAGLVAPAFAADAQTYRMPPKVVADILTAPRVPRVAPSVSADGARMLLADQPSLIPIATLAEPVEKLAGLEILPVLRTNRAGLKAASGGFSIVSIASGARVRAQLPGGARVGNLQWSPLSDRIACAVFASGGSELWIVDAAAGSARRLDGVALNTVLRGAFQWAPDGKSLFCAVVPGDLPALGDPNRVPSGPQVRVGAGRPTPQRTARDVLRSSDDQARFAWYTRSRLVRVPADGGAAQPVGGAGLINDWSVAPDGQHLLVSHFTEPVPVGFPFMLFPHVIEVWNADGSRAATVGEAPLNDRSAVSSVAELGPRSVGWAPDGQSLWYFSWQDTPGADPLKAIRDTSLAQPGTDRLMRLDAPFTGEASVVATSDQQFQGSAWSADRRTLLVYDAYSPRRRLRAWWIDPSQKSPTRHVLFSRSTEGVYDDPGRPLAKPGIPDAPLWTSPDGKAIYLSGDGFRADGQRPFLDRVELATGKKTRIYESDADHLEPVLVLLAADGKRFITLRQSNREAPNYFARKAGEKLGKKLSDYTDPAPALTASQRIQFKFMRPDSVWLNAEAVLPADWKPGTKLPTIFWVYPNDYRSAAAASQNRRSPNRFPSQSTLNPEVLVTQGYAVVYPDIAVVGTNDAYVKEIGMSAKAAIDECARRGFCDPDRVGVGGHSYGAFSTANLLAHTDLFRAGTSSDGAYNRTLTPFTFQAEERTLWEARDTYLQMSPFLYADKIRAPLLLLHNLDDTNVGTNPIQSQRMFEAMNGLGKTVSLIEYPYEDHGPTGRETVLDYWARLIEWFDKYVKNAPAKSAGATETGGR
jgi:dipeptidyl aminopeptidase/acylaminoacyl peptidase